VSATIEEIKSAIYTVLVTDGHYNAYNVAISAIDELAELRAELAALKEQLRWRKPDEEPDWSKAGQYGELHLEMQFGNRSATEIMIYDKEDFNDNPCTAWRPALPGPEEVG